MASNFIANSQNIEETIKHAANFINKSIELTELAINKASVDLYSGSTDHVTESMKTAQQIATNSFSWGGYIQAIGILFFLLAILWVGVWLIRRYGKFNFLPRPGSLPRDALLMEAQMPLGPKKGLMVVRFLNKRLLLGVTEHNITLLVKELVKDERSENNFQNIINDEVNNTNLHSGIDNPSP